MRSKSVLVVEDDDNSADLLSTFARSEGFVASIASSLAEARQQLIVHKPGIVLLDLGLPDGSGMDLEACAWAWPAIPPVVPRSAPRSSG